LDGSGRYTMALASARTRYAREIRP
jgi:hypothetical protein